MFAIVRFLGKQYRVRPGDRVTVDRIDAPEGEEVALGDVLLVGDDDRTTVGAPTVAGASVRARIEVHDRAAKVTSFDYKNKTRQKTQHGHKQHQTRVVITDITAG
jgi:large subunit ribosomal protein L21